MMLLREVEDLLATLEKRNGWYHGTIAKNNMIIGIYLNDIGYYTTVNGKIYPVYATNDNGLKTILLKIFNNEPIENGTIFE